MTRNSSIDYPALRNEYVYADPPISLTDLAEKHGHARSAIAEVSTRDHWYEDRQEFRLKLGQNTRLALAEEFAVSEAAHRRKIAKTAIAVLDKFATDLADDKIQINAKDAALWAGVLRQEHEDMRQVALPPVIEGHADDMDEERARQTIADVEKLLASGSDAPRHN